MSFSGTEWDRVPASAKDLIASMLHSDPVDRIDIADSLLHGFFREAQQISTSLKKNNSILNRISRNCAYQVCKMEVTLQVANYYHMLLINKDLIAILLKVFDSSDEFDDGAENHGIADDCHSRLQKGTINIRNEIQQFFLASYMQKEII